MQLQEGIHPQWTCVSWPWQRQEGMCRAALLLAGAQQAVLCRAETDAWLHRSHAA